MSVLGTSLWTFDEVTKCDEKQLNTSVNTETSCRQNVRVHQASLFFFIMAAVDLFEPRKPREDKERLLVHMQPPVDPVSLSEVLGLVLAVSHTTE